MKAPTVRGDKGSVILVILVLIFMLIFLGYTLWQIWKILQGVTVEPEQQPEVVAGQMLTEFQSNHVNEPVTSVSTQVVTLTLVRPFDPAEYAERVWRSTNLIDWDCIATNWPGDSWSDTNAPWPNGFYWREPIP